MAGNISGRRLVSSLLMGLMITGAACTSIETRDEVSAQNLEDYDLTQTDMHGLKEAEGAYITFAEGPCFGACPVYEMLITPDDRYYVYPERFTHREQPYSGELPRGSFNKIHDLTVREPYRSLKADYTPDSGNCGAAATDMPSAKFSIQTPAATRSMDVYWGCSTARGEVRDFFSQLKTILEVSRTVYEKPGR
ncbi:MAG: DUF6438 domain-containing protein [Robiginitomaculum sp.]